MSWVARIPARHPLHERDLEIGHTKKCTQLRNLIKNCDNLKQYSNTKQNDSAQFLQHLIRILPHDTSLVSTEILVEYDEESLNRGYRPRTIEQILEPSIIYNVPVNLIKSINKQNPKHIKDFLIQKTTDILVRDGKEFTKNETKELIKQRDIWKQRAKDLAIVSQDVCQEQINAWNEYKKFRNTINNRKKNEEWIISPAFSVL